MTAAPVSRFRVGDVCLYAGQRYTEWRTFDEIMA